MTGIDGKIQMRSLAGHAVLYLRTLKRKVSLSFRKTVAVSPIIGSF